MFETPVQVESLPRSWANYLSLVCKGREECYSALAFRVVWLFGGFQHNLLLLSRWKDVRAVETDYIHDGSWGSLHFRKRFRVVRRFCSQARLQLKGIPLKSHNNFELCRHYGYGILGSSTTPTDVPLLIFLNTKLTSSTVIGLEKEKFVDIFALNSSGKILVVCGARLA